MDAQRDNLLIEGGLESACHKAGKLLVQGEFVTRQKFLELFLESVKRQDYNCINCTELMYTEHDSNRWSYCVLFDILTDCLYFYRCSFTINFPDKDFKGQDNNMISIEEWEMNKPIDAEPDRCHYFD